MSLSQPCHLSANRTVACSTTTPEATCTKPLAVRDQPARGQLEDGKSLRRLQASWVPADYALLGNFNGPRCFHLDLDQLTADARNCQFRLQVNTEILVLSSRNLIARRIDEVRD